MSWCDVLYPGNYERRQNVYKLLQKIVSCIEFTFDATNELVEIVNKYLLEGKEKINKITMNHTGTIESNCNALVKKLEELQKVVELRFKRLADKLDPEIYRKLNDPNASYLDIIRLVQKISQTVVAIAGGVAGVVVCLFVRMRCVAQALTTLQTVCRMALASLAVGVITLAVDLVISAIIGAVERNKLEKSIKELQDTLTVFEPASKKFCKGVIQISVLIEMECEE